MSGRLQEKLRELLRAAPDGMTATELQAATGRWPGVRNTQVYMSLARMPDVYIDRWTAPPMSAVYMAVEVPPNCPKPEKRDA